MDYFPIFFKLVDEQVLVVGAGDIALRKVGLLLKAGARVRIVAPEICTELQQLVGQGRLEYEARPFAKEDLQSVALVIAATNDAKVNKQISALARKRHLPVNVVDSPELCSFVMPAIIDRSPLVVAVSSGGKAPVLARMLRARLESLIPQNYGRLAALAAKFRSKVKKRIATLSGRRRFWEEVFEGSIGGRVLAGGDIKKAEKEMDQALNSVDTDFRIQPEAAIIGVVADDPEALSIRATRLMQKADVVFVDPDVAEVVTDRSRRDAEKHHLLQPLDMQKIVDQAGQGKRVIYLTCSDVSTSCENGDYDSLLQSQLQVQIIPAAPMALQARVGKDNEAAGWQQLMRFED